MTVQELINKLLQCDSDKEVWICPVIRSSEISSVEEDETQVMLS